MIIVGVDNYKLAPLPVQNAILVAGSRGAEETLKNGKNCKIHKKAQKKR